MTIIAYTDGACSGNPGPGGWAWARTDGPWASGADPHTTNQRMEIMAAYEAVRSTAGDLEVVSDSTYVVNCFRDKWWEGWIKRGWRNSKKEPVANRDLWEPFIELVRSRDNVTFRWVKGHSNDPMNDMADRLAVAAALSQRGDSGVVLPDVSKLAADPVAPTAAAQAGVRKDRRLPNADIATHGVAIFGHRASELGGYEDNPIAKATRSQLEAVLSAQREMNPDIVVVSGLRLGAEMLGAEAAISLDIPLIVVLPYPNPESVWSPEFQAKFKSLVASAAEIVTLERKVPETRQAAGAALSRRDAWLARQVGGAILVWDEQNPAYKSLASSLEDHLGDSVWYLHPPALG